MRRYWLRYLGGASRVFHSRDRQQGAMVIIAELEHAPSEISSPCEDYTLRSFSPTVYNSDFVYYMFVEEVNYGSQLNQGHGSSARRSEGAIPPDPAGFQRRSRLEGHVLRCIPSHKRSEDLPSSSTRTFFPSKLI